MKIAPTLRWMVDTAVYPDTKDNWVKADKELRALLAVVREAGRLIDPQDRGDPTLLPMWQRLDRALARLEKVSGRKP